MTDRAIDRDPSASGRARVLVLMGGPDAERPVSIASGTAVAAALREAGIHDVSDLVIERPDKAELDRIVRDGVDVVFPVLHGPWGEGGPLQGLLEELGVPFVGSGAHAARIAMDKVATKTLAQQMGVPTPSARVLMVGDECDLEPPVVLKPLDDGSSVDIHVCRSVDELVAARSALHRSRPRLLAERYIAGREITVGFVLDRLLPPIEIRPADGLYDYEAKYVRNDTEYLVDCQLDPNVAASIRRHAEAILRRIGCRDLARVDFMLDERGPWLLEVNTIPGFTDHSLVPKAAATVGLPMPVLCTALVERALARGSRAPTTASSLPTPTTPTPTTRPR